MNINKNKLRGAAAVLFFMILILIVIGSKKMVIKVNYLDLGGDIQIIGSLNKPLGEILTVEGIIVDDTYTKRKSDSGKLLLKVESINGEKISNEIIISFSAFKWVSIKEVKVDDYKKFIGYETGAMTGIPEKAFEYMPQVATEGFHFSTYFQICKEL
ncbi:hypothetical protein KAU33_14090 [Candidatus Dependentiae bacterium]|nr:hypothetical protein [Candidatus Dependentiae bacterium]